MNFNHSSQQHSPQRNSEFSVWGGFTALAIAVTTVTSFGLLPAPLSAQIAESAASQTKQNRTDPAIAKFVGQYNLVLSPEDAAILKRAGISATGRILIQPNGKYDVAMNLGSSSMRSLGTVELKQNKLILRDQNSNGTKNSSSQSLTILQGGKVLQVDGGKKNPFKFVKQ